MAPHLRLTPPAPEVHLDRLLAALDGLDPADGIALLTGALGHALAKLGQHERAFAWFATTQAIMLELHVPPIPPVARAA